MDIGAKLKELRILKGLTQEELADRAELSKGFISQLVIIHTLWLLFTDCKST